MGVRMKNRGEDFVGFLGLGLIGIAIVLLVMAAKSMRPSPRPFPASQPPPSSARN